MRKTIALALLLLAASALGQATNAKSSPAPDASQAVEARMRAYLDALHKNDLAAIGQFFADDYTYTGVDGVFMTKAQRLDNIKRTPPPATLDFTDLKIRIYGDTAVVTGHVTSATGPNGQAINNRTIWVWNKQGGTWRLIAAQNTNIAPVK